MLKTGEPGIEVSVVIPAFNEAERLPQALPLLINAIDNLDASVEIMLIDDGSTDDTSSVARRYLGGRDDARIIRLPWNCGKGAAVRVGVSAASGSSIVFLDADLAADIEYLPRLLEMLETADVALGSRTRAGAKVEGRTAARQFGGAVYQALVRHLTAASVVDTQCGFKAFRGPVAKLLFSMTSATGFGFDVEILTLASTLGLRVEDCPIRWTAVDGGHVSLRQHGLGMLRDLQRARRHQQRERAWNWTVSQAGGWRLHLATPAEAAGSHHSPDIIRLDPPELPAVGPANVVALG